ncbi:MAG: hypothetical protein A2Z14_08210 [Chloroflexi bacterium RBG_16_48_8]|nr:MAG: hypothetical protein A2Z14_08210 [Chloroflexi bacterium RBG_16_48_8]
MDFENPPSKPGDYVIDFRKDSNILLDECIILQLTRIVPCKRIELAIELARRLKTSCILLITHETGDEGTDDEKYLHDFAELQGVKVTLDTKWVNHYHNPLPDGGKIYSLTDAYHQANIVSYPATIEGFGIAFLETIYYKRPIVISTYEIFKTDIQSKGLPVVGFDDFISEETVRMARYVFENAEFRHQMVEDSYKTGHRNSSFANLEANLAVLIKYFGGA